MRILLIEGDSATAQSIELMLQSEGLNVYATDLGREGVDLGKLYDYDIILLDLNLSDMSGYEVLKALRVSKVSTPILILSGLTGIEDKVRGLGFGADDYMTKPFHKDELVARIHAIVRRSKDHAPSVIETGEIKVNLDTKTVEVHNQRVHLTSKEYQMLELLSLRKGTTLTKEMFLNHLYGGMDEPDLKIIDVFIAKLRKKLVAATGSDHYIATIPGIGYALKDSAPVGPLLGIPSAFDFRLSAGKIALTSGLTNWPVFLLPTSEQDHNNRLAVCRTLAADLTSDLKAGKFNARTDYAESLKKYVQRLPKGPGEGNILLADAEARTLRNMFAADADSLSVGLGSKLKTMLEQHIGLRVYYPEIEHFYRDVQTGRIETPLPLDAVQEFVRRVGDHTPAVFDPTARDAIAGSAAPGPGTVPPPAPTGLPVDPNQPAPPPDPLGEIDPRKARDFTFAGAVNNLWKAFREGEKVHKALDGWKKAGEALQPSVQKILEWLRDFSGPGDGSPPVPPSIGV